MNTSSKHEVENDGPGFMPRLLCTKSLISLCNLCVLCVSVVVFSNNS